MAKESQSSWKTEVAGIGFDREAKRKVFYEKIARLKVQTDPNKLLDNPADNGFKTFDDLKGLPKFSQKVKSGDTLSKYLLKYFSENAGIKTREMCNKEMALSLFHLTQQKDPQGRSINVDRLMVGWQVNIEDGVMTVVNAKGEKVWEANLRKASEAAAASPSKKAEAELKDLGGEIGAAKNIEISETLPNMPRVVYKYKRSKYTPEAVNRFEDARQEIQKHYEKADPDEEFVITLTGTADKVMFILDKRSKKRRVDLRHGAAWRADYRRAMEALQSDGFAELAGLNFTVNDIEAIYALPLADQQTVMNHALAWLRADRLRSDLVKEFPGKNVRYEIKTQWIQDPYTRVATVIDLKYKEKVDRTPEPEPETPRPPESEPEPETPRPPEPEPEPEPESEPPRPPEPEPPRPPESEPKPETPYMPGEIIEIIKYFENDKYNVSTTAVVAPVTPTLLNPTDTWTAPQLRNSNGQTIQYYFLIDKANPNNPKYYIAINKDNPKQIAIGKNEYTSKGLRTVGKTLPISSVVNIDTSSRAKTEASIRSVFSNLPS